MDDFNNQEQNDLEQNNQEQNNQQLQEQNSYAQQDPYAQQNYYAQPEQPPKKGMSIASMVLGIASIVLSCVWYLAGPAAIVGLILGIISLKGKKGSRGMSIAGVICSAVGLVISICFMIFAIYVAQHPELGTTSFWENYMQQ